MSKRINDIVPEKVIINLKENGSYKDAILVYRIKEESGEVDSNVHTMPIDSEISKPVINGILSNVKQFVKQKEKDFNNT